MNCAVSATLPQRSAEKPSTFCLFRAREELRSLEEWLLSAEALKLPLHEVEREQERRGREVQRLMLEAHVRERGLGDVGPAVRVLPSAEDPGGAVLTHRRPHRLEHHSIFGEIRIERLGYGHLGREGIHPLDSELQLPRRSFSYELERRLVKAAAQGPFEEACERVEESTGVNVPKRTAEQIVAEGAVDFEAFYATRQPPSEAQTGSILVASADGKGIPMVKPGGAEPVVRLGRGEKANKKKMATVACVYSIAPYVRTPEEIVEKLFHPKPRDEREPSNRPRPEFKRVWASLQRGKEEVLKDVGQEMDRRDPERKKTWAALTDGDRALQKKVLEVLKAFGEVILILDFLHVLGKLWKAAHVFCKEGSPEAKEWVRNRALRILRGEVSQVVKGMRQSATKRKFRGQKKKTVESVAGYLYRNRQYMKYDEYLAAGLPIASGSVEGACKNLVKDRMERSGMRWKEEGAEPVLKLRATYLSGDLQEYWTFHIRREQSRLHPVGMWEAMEEAVVEK